MTATIFDVNGVSGHRRERIEEAAVAAGKHASGPLTEFPSPCPVLQ